MSLPLAGPEGKPDLLEAFSRMIDNEQSSYRFLTVVVAPGGPGHSRPTRARPWRIFADLSVDIATFEALEAIRER